MKRLPLLFLLAGAALSAQTPAAAQNAATIFDNQLRNIEGEFVSLVKAMPADKMNFAPESGEFKGVRTFAQQATHVAAVIYVTASATLGEKNPSEAGANENGPASLKTKEEIVKYVEDAFAYGHKAMLSLTNKNLTDEIPSPFGKGKMARVAAATVPVWHSFDHYGQMVVYARMNGVVPPASRGQ